MHAGGHRYFSHQSFKCVPWLAVAFAVTLAETEMPILWYWIFLHNEHHMHCDREDDIHSPVHSGFWAIQLGLNEGFADAAERVMALVGPGAPPNKIMKTRYDADISWMNLFGALPIFLGSPIAFGLLGYSLGYYPGEFIFFGTLLPRFLTVQMAALTNSAAHMWGTRPYTGNKVQPFPNCMATNCWWVALINGGEGWHNNHHAFCKSARHGLLWWEVDTVWISLRALAHLGLVWDLVEASEEVRLSPRTPGVEQKIQNKYVTKFKKSKCI